MAITLGFDIYGTLIDPHGVTVKLGELIGDKAVDFHSPGEPNNSNTPSAVGSCATTKTFRFVPAMHSIMPIRYSNLTWTKIRNNH